MNIDIIIKSFMRPTILRQCVESVRRFYDHRIIVADDSTNFHNPLDGLNVEVCRLPYDVGLSAGRNYLVKQVRSPLFLLLDSDFLLTDEHTIERLHEVLEETNSTLTAGLLWDAGVDSPRSYYGHYSRQGPKTVINYYDPRRTHFEETKSGIRYCGCRFTENFFLARTEDFLQYRIHWDESLKLMEHEDFFIRFPTKLRISMTPDVHVRHLPSYENGGYDPAYSQFRYRQEFKRLAEQKHPYIEKHNTIFDWTQWNFPRIRSVLL